jgi:hypothetical protein
VVRRASIVWRKACDGLLWESGGARWASELPLAAKGALRPPVARRPPDGIVDGRVCQAACASAGASSQSSASALARRLRARWQRLYASTFSSSSP